MFVCLSDSIAAHSSDEITKKIFDVFLPHELFLEHLDGDDGLAPLSLVNLAETSFCDASRDFDLVEIDFENRLDRFFFFELGFELGDDC